MNGAPTPLSTAGPGAGHPRPSASASPATMAGTTPQAPAGQPIRRRRPRPQAEVLRAPRRPLKTITRPTMSLTQMQEGLKKPENHPGSQVNGAIPVEVLRHELLSQGARPFPLVVTRRDLKELRHHVMRLQSREKVDVQDQEHFTPPIRLHRRDPRAPPSGAGSHFEEEDTKEDIEESKERERIEIAKEERRKIREENLSKIAPSGTKKPPAFQKKTEQKYRPDDTPQAKKRQLLRYEETLPWHLEDFDNKQTWVGTYESELSEAHVMLTTDHPVDGRGPCIQLAPMERWYRFNQKSKAKSTDDPELIKEKLPSFLRNIENKQLLKEQELLRDKGTRRMRTRVGGGADDEGRIQRFRGDDDDAPVKREHDADDIDFNLEEDFADDEEGLNGLFEGEEGDLKETEERMKRDQLGAAVFELRNEDEVYREEERERKEAERAKELEKAMRKSLIKREKNIEYDLDDDDNPYEEKSESDTDSETERQRAKEEEERKAAEQNGKTSQGDKLASGASTKGATTPSGSQKPGDINKKKRPGSPNLSEASGNESSRKKHKKKHLKDGKSHLSEVTKRGAASGSDSEMTDAGRPKKQKLKVRIGGSPGASPNGSRAGSPAAQANGSRAGSPAAPGGTPTIASQNRLPSATEIYKALPAEGMTIQSLITTFKDRVDKSNTQLFIRLVKAVSSFDKQRSWLIPLPQMPSDEQINAVMRGNRAGAPKAATPS